MPPEKEATNPYMIPGAIVLAAALIAGAIYFNGSSPAPRTATENEPPTEVEFRAVDESDYIRGNPNAPIMLVEYSDYDCPFCSQFHTTMNQVMEKYGSTGKIAWVYRHFPIEQLHPNAPKIAEASECVAELGGEGAFWTFSDLVFSEKPIETRNGQNYIGATDMSRLPEFAETAGVERARFELCFNSGKYEQKIEDAIAEAQAAGGGGTPHTLVIAGNEIIDTIPGAFPFKDFNDSTGQRQLGMDSIIAELISKVPDQPAVEAE